MDKGMLEGRPTPDTPEEAEYVERILRMPYSFILIPDGEEGGFSALILEFPGCFAQGETPGEAHENLRTAARGWILAALDSSQTIPRPLTDLSHGTGWVRFQMPKTMHARAAQIAQTEGVTLDQFVLATVAEKIGELAPLADQPNWAPQAERAFAIAGQCPDHFKAFLLHLILQATQNPRLRPFVDLLMTDAHYLHLLAGKPPAQFL